MKLSQRDALEVGIKLSDNQMAKGERDLPDLRIISLTAAVS
jgi:hypothetical protein